MWGGGLYIITLAFPQLRNVKISSFFHYNLFTFWIGQFKPDTLKNKAQNGNFNLHFIYIIFSAQSLYNRIVLIVTYLSSKTNKQTKQKNKTKQNKKTRYAWKKSVWKVENSILMPACPLLQWKDFN